MYDVNIIIRRQVYNLRVVLHRCDTSCVSPRNEYKVPSVFENRALGRVLGSEREKRKSKEDGENYI
jgi:hypothetical protein